MTEFDEFGIFLESLIAVAGKAAAKMKSRSPHRSLEDLQQSGYEKILIHLPLICSADKKLGMAFRVAEGALKNIGRKAYLHREVAVSQLTKKNDDGDDVGVGLDDVAVQNDVDQYADLWTERRLNQLPTIVREQLDTLNRENSAAAQVVNMTFALYPYAECGGPD